MIRAFVYSLISAQLYFAFATLDLMWFESAASVQRLLFVVMTLVFTGVLLVSRLVVHESMSMSRMAQCRVEDRWKWSGDFIKKNACTTYEMFARAFAAAYFVTAFVTYDLMWWESVHEPIREVYFLCSYGLGIILSTFKMSALIQDECNKYFR